VLNVKIEADDSSIIGALLVNGAGFSLLAAINAASGQLPRDLPSRGAFQFLTQDNPNGVRTQGSVDLAGPRVTWPDGPPGERSCPQARACSRRPPWPEWETSRSMMPRSSAVAALEVA
jgi:hypothetical protein